MRSLPESRFATLRLARIPTSEFHLSYQNFDVDLKAENGEVYPTTLASFVGYNTYIESFTLNEETIEVNGNKLQGYWGWKSWATPCKARPQRARPLCRIRFGIQLPSRKGVAS